MANTPTKTFLSCGVWCQYYFQIEAFNANGVGLNCSVMKLEYGFRMVRKRCISENFPLRNRFR